MSFVNSRGSGQDVHQRSLIRAFSVDIFDQLFYTRKTKTAHSQADLGICNKDPFHILRLGCSSNPLPFHTEFLTWTLPSLNLDTSIVSKGISVKNQSQNSKQCRSK